MQMLKQQSIHTWLASGAQSLQNSKFHQVCKVFVFGVHSPGGKPDLTIWVYIFHCSLPTGLTTHVSHFRNINVLITGSILDSSGGSKWCRQIHPIILFNIQKCLSFESHLARVADKGSWIWPRTKQAQPSFQGYRLNKDFTRMPLKTSQVLSCFFCIWFFPWFPDLRFATCELPLLLLSLSSETLYEDCCPQWPQKLYQDFVSGPQKICGLPFFQSSKFYYFVTAKTRTECLSYSTFI